MTIRICAVRNPFDPVASREIRDVEPGRSVMELYKEMYPSDTPYYVETAIDGVRVTDPATFDIVPEDGSAIVFCAVPVGGGGKNPLAIIAMLALMVYAGPLANIMMEGLGGMAFTGGWVAGATTIGIAQAGIMIAGGLAIQAIFPMSLPDAPGAGSFEKSSTYSWTPGGNTLVEGSPLPEIYGTHRVTPPIISKYIETLGDKQYLNVLYAVAGHAVTSIGDIQINGTDIGDFDNVTYETKLGATTQQVLQYFGDTRTDVSVGAKINPDADPWLTGTTYNTGDKCTYGTYYWQSLGDGNQGNTPAEDANWTQEIWTLRTTTGNTVQGIGVVLSLPVGLYYANDSGGMDAQTVNVYVEYSLKDADDWTRLETFTTVSSYVATPRWSGGYWGYADEGGSIPWIEVENGGTTYDDGVHTEGAPFASGVWTIDEGGTTRRDIGIWRWIAGETIKVWDTILVDYVIITAAQTAPIHRMYPKDNLPAGQYDIRCRLRNVVPDDSRYGNDTYFESFQEIVYDDFTYPGTALLAVRALATDQLSGGMPTVTALVSRATVPVWTGAAYAAKDAFNPAWTCYHLLHRAEYKGTGVVTAAASYNILGVPAARIDYAAFSSWADWCDDPAGDASQTAFTCNIYFDQVFSLRKALDIASANGRGAVVQLGSKFTCIVDRPEETPVQRFMFNMGNIEADSFTEEWLPMGDRANAIEVTYFDATEDYTRQVVTLYASDFDTTTNEINTRQATLYGCTSRDLAIRYGTFLLNCNRYLTLTCSFNADVDSIACIPGDVIEVSHDVPQWGYSGRVVSATANTITLDRSVTVGLGTHTIRVKHADDTFEEFPVTSAAGTYTTLSIASETWVANPVLHELYSVGVTAAVVKLFRVLRISRDQDMRKKITCIEYVAAVYTDGATIAAPESISTLAAVVRMSATETWKSGTETVVSLTWYGAAISWYVFHRVSGDVGWIHDGIAYGPQYEISGLHIGVTYEFCVSGTENPEDGLTDTVATVGQTYIIGPGGIIGYDDGGDVIIDIGGDSDTTFIANYADHHAIELELMKMNFQSISWAQFAVYDTFDDSTRRASPDPSTYDARVFKSQIDHGTDTTANRYFGFVSKTYTAITTVDSGTSTDVGVNYLEDTGQAWFTDECVGLTLYDSVATPFTVTANTGVRLTVSGSPAAGAYTLVDDDPAYAVAFASFTDSTNGGNGYVQMEVSFNGGSNYQEFLNTETAVDILGGTVDIDNPGSSYIVRITLKNDGSGNGPLFHKFLVCTDPSCWRS